MEIFFELYVPPVSRRYVQKLEGNWKNYSCIKVGNFRKSVNFEALQHSARIKIQNNNKNVGKILGFVILLVVITYTIHVIL